MPGQIDCLRLIQRAAIAKAVYHGRRVLAPTGGRDRILLANLAWSEVQRISGHR